MHTSLAFIRILFFTLCVLFFATFTAAKATESTYYTSLFAGIASGILFGGALVGLEFFFKPINLRTFNTAALGLLFGYLMGEALLLISEAVFQLSHAPAPETYILIRAGIFLVSAYFGMTLTAKASEELYVSVPFIKFKPNSQKKKDFLIDASLLLDSRILDLTTSGLLDDHLILPRCIIKELYDSAESGDDTVKAKARRCAEVIKKLENIPTLGLRYTDLDFPEIKDTMSKLVRIARLLDANIFTGDINRMQQSSIEGIRVININALSIALKPLAQAGEFINIKVQRYGKEPRQGVGYLDDGTMVVVNGGAEFIGEGIRAQVLSVKHTSSGRMIFCNATEDHTFNELTTTSLTTEEESQQKSYFTL